MRLLLTHVAPAIPAPIACGAGIVLGVIVIELARPHAPPPLTHPLSHSKEVQKHSFG